jgi:hypothetical protein
MLYVFLVHTQAKIGQTLHGMTLKGLIGSDNSVISACYLKTIKCYVNVISQWEDLYSNTDIYMWTEIEKIDMISPNLKY